jgi:quinol monooxygenase YgiN
MGMADCQGKANGGSERRSFMIIVTGQARFGQGEIERLKSALKMNIQASRAEAGCARYDYSVDISDPDLLHISEEWSDEEAIADHMAAPHMAQLLSTLGDARLESISINAYEAHFLRPLLGSG